MTAEDTFDIIIAGGGTAGCALASRLKQGNSSFSIALIERGADESTNPVVLHASGRPKLIEAGLDTLYPTTPQSHLNDRIIQLHAGNLLSGSSGINAGLWMRPQKADLDDWAGLLADEEGSERWSYAGLLPYFRKIESHWDRENGDRQAHGFDGPIKTRPTAPFPLRQPVHDGLLETGFEDNRDHLNGDSLGIGRYTENWTPLRQPASLAYDLSGVTVITHATVHKILFKKGEGEEIQASGVQLVDGRIFHAGKEVVLSCGAYRTPQVLMLSGIGAREELDRHNIDIVLENPDVGKNFLDHAGVFLPWRLKSETAEAGLAIGHPKFMANPAFHEGVPADWITGAAPDVSVLKSALQLDNPDEMIADSHRILVKRAHYYLVVVYYVGPTAGSGFETFRPDGNCISLSVMDFLPSSRGSITLASTNPLDPPVCDPNYNATHQDRYTMRAGLRRVLQLGGSEAMKPYLVEDGQLAPEGFNSLSSNSSDEELDARIRHSSITIHHGMGTAAMGKVVDAKLRVKGIEGLRICDASVFPASVAATPQSTVYAVAESLADLMLEEYS